MSDRFPIIVFSHLRWKFVYQRPQHLISRLAKDRPILFIEEPIFDDQNAPRFVFHKAAENVTVCEPYTDIKHAGFNGPQNAVISDLLSNALQSLGISDYVLWFYSPMALPIADTLTPKAIVYDCMDELSAFAHAPTELLEREQQLLDAADVVFTGGPSLYDAKKNRHRNVHCFSSSVDAAHFGQAKSNENEIAEQQTLPHPRLGFFGVIDERFDVPLLEYLAQQRPDWQFALVGPIVKIDPSSLPHLPNIHYFGQQSYEVLPHFLSGWDVCLLPFARNEATRYISPTKTLEYMAAEKMIVSTPIKDVADPYGDIVFLGDTPEQFLKACDTALNLTSDERNRRIDMMRDVLAATSWDSTAEQMANALIEAERHRSRGHASASQQATSKPTNRVKPQPANRLRIDDNAEPTVAPNRIAAAIQISGQDDASTPSVVVIGAGPTGLSAAYHLGDDALLLEANDTVGGWCRSIEVDGFTFDFAGHIMFSNDPYVHAMYETLLGDNVHWQDREAWVYSKNVFTRYPFQGALYGLPAEVITECIVGAVEARYGVEPNTEAAKKVSHTNGNLAATNGGVKTDSVKNGASPIADSKNGSEKNGLSAKACAGDQSINDCCADGVLESTAALAQKSGVLKPNAEPSNFEEFIYKVWGRGIAKHFAIPYNRKLWAVPLSEMETSWLGGRVPMPDLAQMIEGAIKPVPKPMGPNARFGYPLKGGFQALMNGFLPYVENNLMLGAKVKSISPSLRIVTLADGQKISYDSLISTMPLPALIHAMGDEAPQQIHEAADGLRNVSVRCVNLGIGREKLTEKHWIYYPEETIFHRIFVQGNASPHCNPAGGFGLTCEITYSSYKPLPCDGDELIQRCIDDCIKVGIIDKHDPVLTAVQCDMPYAYVVYDHARPKNIATIRDWLDTQGIILAGRYSEWEYYNSDHAFLAGKKAAEKARSLEADYRVLESAAKRTAN